jgi:hypothetical protein
LERKRPDRTILICSIRLLQGIAGCFRSSRF